VLPGNLTRWLVEVAAGVYVGRVSSRVREAIWIRLNERIGDGQAVLIQPAHNEQGWTARTAGQDRYRPVEIDGITLFRPRPELPPVVDTDWLATDWPVGPAHE